MKIEISGYTQRNTFEERFFANKDEWEYFLTCMFGSKANRLIEDGIDSVDIQYEVLAAEYDD